MGTGISDTPEDLPKEALRQVAFRLLEDEVRSMPIRRPPVLKSRGCRLVSDQL